MPVDGVVLVDKPAGPTSFDIVARVRRTLPRGTKVGHSGTLDPFATGLLLILLGRATRIQRYLMALPKAYETVAQLGWTSTTGDPEGELVHTGRMPPRDVTLPIGRIRQRPPAYSAVKIDGRRAYAMARAGEAVEIPEREIYVTGFEERWREGDCARYDIRCSSGTYVRSLIADLGDAYCVELRRTQIGPFRVEEAIAPPDRSDAAPFAPRVLTLAQALNGVLPAVPVDADAARRAGHGQVVDITGGGHWADAPTGDVYLVDPDGEAVCVADVTDGRAKPRVGFRA
ncbi:tRNA pseudouridine(55) synthase TruB [Baekduia sp.]|uniref:tRNA pseudouridine(55) synthase TruB n=1 Tax=Baekduia sp. TaxID=2600305 RepID=UPI002E00B251|nr:tRNA pseudouridine(55) synthase TruB [Baekduia sp.]